jgi:hypothetical protein
MYSKIILQLIVAEDLEYDNNQNGVKRGNNQKEIAESIGVK